ncbi:unnamed protein product [Dracunculus medinensis]|uniref:Uncharacterized protein n=1 Tax=Dracunculus medinensis TaxID=318479 RepID=A0A0N4UHI2_DRAME|nr:unnamed protein product [Dracunculus medinensis]
MSGDLDLLSGMEEKTPDDCKAILLIISKKDNRTYCDNYPGISRCRFNRQHTICCSSILQMFSIQLILWMVCNGILEKTIRLIKAFYQHTSAWVCMWGSEQTASK